MTLAELVAEVEGYGFSYEPSNRIESWIQRANQLLEARYTWPWSEETVEGKAPLEIKDLRSVLSVTDKSLEAPLWGEQRQWLAEAYPDLEEAGSPLWWFLDNITLRIFPTSTSDTIVVRYARKAAELKGAEEPLVPEEWQHLLVKRAVVEGYERNSNLAAASEMKELFNEGLQEMVAAELKRDLQSPRLMVRSGGPWDYL